MRGRRKVRCGWCGYDHPADDKLCPWSGLPIARGEETGLDHDKPIRWWLVLPLALLVWAGLYWLLRHAL